MRRRSRLATALALTAFGVVGVEPADAAASEAFVAAFAAVCIPERLSYEKTADRAKAEGWSVAERSAHPELAAVMAKSDAGLAEAKAEGLEMAFSSQIMKKDVSGRPLHLVLSLTESEYLDEIGCYLYDFEATEAVPANLVSDLLGIKPANAMHEADLKGYVWGPPPAMPRTLDTYLTFIPPGSPYVAQAGFDGVVLKFSTSAPDGAQ